MKNWAEVSAWLPACNRLCELALALLKCDYAAVYLWQLEADAYVRASFRGAAAHRAASAELRQVSRAAAGALLERFTHRHAVQVDSRDLPPAARIILHGLPRAVCFPLRQGTDIVGLLAAGRRSRRRRFNEREERLGIGLVQLATQAIDKALEADWLERASRLKSEVVATMSHELRAPLGVIMGYTDLLLEGGFGRVTHEQAEILRRVDASSRAALDLVNASLDLSRLEFGRLPLEVTRVQLTDLMAELDAETRELRRSSGLRFEWQLPAELPELETDPFKLKVVLKNLITNAVKFTDQGSVTIALQASGEGVQFSVVDTGIGIAPEALSLVFDPFRQAGPHATQRGGVGLGLYITRRLVERLSGSITVQSEVGRGSAFHVWLPCRPRRSDAPAATSDEGG